MVKLRAERRAAAANGRLIPGVLTGSPGGGGSRWFILSFFFWTGKTGEMCDFDGAVAASPRRDVNVKYSPHLRLRSSIFSPAAKQPRNPLPVNRTLLVYLFSPLFAAQTDSGCVVKHLGEASAQLFVTSRRADFPEAGVLLCGRVEFSAWCFWGLLKTSASR